MADHERPILGRTAREATGILGVSSAFYMPYLVAEGRLSKARMYAKRGLDPDAVERVALERLRPGRRHPCWAATAEVAEMLGFTQARVPAHRLERLPAVHSFVRWYFRRHQIEVVHTNGFVRSG